MLTSSLLEIQYLHVGQDTSVIAQANSGLDLHVYPDCNQNNTCDIPDAIYGNSALVSTVEWTAVSGVEYLLLITSTVLSSDSSTVPEFQLHIFDREQQYRAFFAKHISELVYIPGTSHDVALQWILNEDPLQLDIDSTRILQRYIMVLFYYSTSNNALSPWRSCGPADIAKGEDDSCVLLEFTRLFDDTIDYVEQPGKNRWLSGRHECDWEGILCLTGEDILEIEICEYYNVYIVLDGRVFAGCLCFVITWIVFSYRLLSWSKLGWKPSNRACHHGFAPTNLSSIQSDDWNHPRGLCRNEAID